MKVDDICLFLESDTRLHLMRMLTVRLTTSRVGIPVEAKSVTQLGCLQTIGSRLILVLFKAPATSSPIGLIPIISPSANAQNSAT